MAVIQNNWCEKLQEKKAKAKSSNRPNTNNSYSTNDNKVKRFTKVTNSTMTKTLRGLRK